MTEPVFLLAMGRSGSTLLQRLLASHSQIAAVGETWLLLPHLSSLRANGAYAEYGHASAVRAIEDFSANLPGGMNGYLAELREFVTRLYAKAAPNHRYFLDKSPPYSLIAPEVLRVFPQSKAIFLWRNPLAVAASNIETWGNPGKWNLYGQHLQRSLAQLVEAYVDNEEHVCSIRYEDLVESPRYELGRLLAYLGLEMEEGLLERLETIRFQGGHIGDPRGTVLYKYVTDEPLDKWKRTMCNYLRKRWCKRYLSWIGRERLHVMGYELGGLLSELHEVPTRPGYLLSDALRMTYGAVWRALEENVIRKGGERRWLLDGWAHRRKLRRAALSHIDGTVRAD
ncbi:MAG: sulfotransferase family protein [Acidimicrobiia bacterium]